MLNFDSKALAKRIEKNFCFKIIINIIVIIIINIITLPALLLLLLRRANG